MRGALAPLSRLRLSFIVRCSFGTSPNFALCVMMRRHHLSSRRTFVDFHQLDIHRRLDLQRVLHLKAESKFACFLWGQGEGKVPNPDLML